MLVLFRFLRARGARFRPLRVLRQVAPRCERTIEGKTAPSYFTQVATHCASIGRARERDLSSPIYRHPILIAPLGPLRCPLLPVSGLSLLRQTFCRRYTTLVFPIPLRSSFHFIFIFSPRAPSTGCSYRRCIQHQPISNSGRILVDSLRT